MKHPAGSVNANLPDDLPFSLEDFEANQTEILLRMNHFLLAYLHRLRDAFDGDLTRAIVLGEIGHHNVTSYFGPQVGIRPGIERDERWTLMECCNAHSLSASTGIPRETIRRKIDALIERGWVERIAGKGLRITPACVDHFAHSFNVPILANLLVTARDIAKILHPGALPSPGRPESDESRPA